MSRLAVPVSGIVAGVPGPGGATWSILQYLLGPCRLGHDAMLVEPVALPPGAGAQGLSGRRVLREGDGFPGIGRRWALLDQASKITPGLSYGEMVEWVHGADVVLNVSGMLTDDALIGAVPVRVLPRPRPCVRPALERTSRASTCASTVTRNSSVSVWRSGPKPVLCRRVGGDGPLHGAPDGTPPAA